MEKQIFRPAAGVLARLPQLAIQGWRQARSERLKNSCAFGTIEKNSWRPRVSEIHAFEDISTSLLQFETLCNPCALWLRAHAVLRRCDAPGDTEHTRGICGGPWCSCWRSLALFDSKSALLDRCLIFLLPSRCHFNREKSRVPARAPDARCGIDIGSSGVPVRQNAPILVV